MKHRIACFVLLLCVASIARAQTSRPVEQIHGVLIISVDGLRPDLIYRADAVNMRRLIESGSFSLWARAIPAANTLPAHVSILTGVSAKKHGITFNDDRATTRPIRVAVPTIFELAKRAGYSTALVAGKAKFVTLDKPGTIDFLWVPDDKKAETDADVADRAGAIIRLHKPQVMLVHFPGADSVGHSKGWGSPEQLAAIRHIDECTGMILNALHTSGLSDSTLVILTADHGGSGRTHGPDDPRSLHIPWIAAGPGIRQNYDLTLVRDLDIRTEDTFATACFVLGIPLPDDIDGRPIVQIIEGYELLHGSKPASKPATAPAR